MSLKQAGQRMAVQALRVRAFRGGCSQGAAGKSALTAYKDGIGDAMRVSLRTGMKLDVALEGSLMIALVVMLTFAGKLMAVEAIDEIAEAIR
jgi:hypothetical protein